MSSGISLSQFNQDCPRATNCVSSLGIGLTSGALKSMVVDMTVLQSSVISMLSTTCYIALTDLTETLSSQLTNTTIKTGWGKVLSMQLTNTTLKTVWVMITLLNVMNFVGRPLIGRVLPCIDRANMRYVYLANAAGFLFKECLPYLPLVGPALTSISSTNNSANITNNVHHQKRIIQAVQKLEHELASLKDPSKSYAQSGMSLFMLLGMLLRAMPPSDTSVFIKTLGLEEMSTKEVEEGLFHIQKELNETKDPEIKIANAMAADSVKIDKSFVHDIFRYHDAALLLPNGDSINKWVNDQTVGMIPKLVDSFEPDDIALMNAVFFKGKWEKSFDKAKTQSDDFMTLSGETVKAQIMYQQGAFNYYRGNGFAVLQKPYITSVGEAFNYTIFLPDNPRDIGTMEKNLRPEFILECQSRMEMMEDIHLYLPKVEIKTDDKQLVDGLKKLGYPVPKDFSAITNNHKPIEMGQVCAIKCDEEGTIAAAVSYAMTKECAGPPPLVFDARKPFIAQISRGGRSYFQMAIKDKTGLVS